MIYGQRDENSSKFVEVNENPFLTEEEANHLIIFPGVWTVKGTLPTYEDMDQLPLNKAFLGELVRDHGAVELKNKWNSVIRHGWRSADQYTKSIEVLLLGHEAKSAKQLNFFANNGRGYREAHELRVTTIAYDDPDVSIVAKNAYKASPDYYCSEEAAKVAKDIGESLFADLDSKDFSKQRKLISQRLSRYTFYGHSFGTVFFGMVMNGLLDVASEMGVDRKKLIESGVIKDSCVAILTGFASNTPLGELEIGNSLPDDEPKVFTGKLPDSERAPAGASARTKSVRRASPSGKWPTTLQVVGVNDVVSKIFSGHSVVKPQSGSIGDIAVQKNDFGVVVFASTPDSIAIKRVTNGHDPQAQLIVDRPRHSNAFFLTPGVHDDGYVEATRNALRLGVVRNVIGISVDEIMREAVGTQVQSFRSANIKMGGGINSVLGLPSASR